MMMNIPARIRRMSRRRQKIAMVRWVSGKISGAMQQFIGRPVLECKDEIAAAIFEQMQHVAQPGVVLSNPRQEGDTLVVDVSGPAPLLRSLMFPAAEPATEKEE